jgi:hypothetical protein
MGRIRKDILELVAEERIERLVPGRSGRRFEASGLCFYNGLLHVVFDDAPDLLCLRPDWFSGGDAPVVRTLRGMAAGYEDITFQPSSGRWYCLVEAAPAEDGAIMPCIDEFDASFTFLRRSRLDFPVRDGNKGFEGLAALYHAGDEYLLCLCEGNRCRGGRKGRKPGKGRMPVFRRKAGATHWEHTGTGKLPKSARFFDYAGLDLRDGRVTILSQSSSAIWTGRLRHLPVDPAGVDTLFADDGQVLLLPRNAKDRPRYCTAEGVARVGPGLLAVVSDRAKGSQPRRCAQKEASVHIFRVPGE